MKLITEYLERAVNLERLAAGEHDSTVRADLLDQAAAYRKLAAKRAEQARHSAGEGTASRHPGPDTDGPTDQALSK